MSNPLAITSTGPLLHELRVYPLWGEPMYDPGLNLLALSYRIVYTVVGGYIWYPIALALTGIPCSWFGGVLYQKTHTKR